MKLKFGCRLEPNGIVTTRECASKVGQERRKKRKAVWRLRKDVSDLVVVNAWWRISTKLDLYRCHWLTSILNTCWDKTIKRVTLTEMIRKVDCQDVWRLNRYVMLLLLIHTKIKRINFGVRAQMMTSRSIWDSMNRILPFDTIRRTNWLSRQLRLDGETRMETKGPRN